MLSDRETNLKFIRNSQLDRVELRLSCYRRHAFDRHTHDTYAISAIFKGRVDFFHHDRTESIGRGALTLINPDEVHACNPQKGSVLSYGMLYVQPGLVQEIGSTLTGRSRDLPRLIHPVVGQSCLFADLQDLCRLAVAEEAGLEMESRLYEILAGLLVHHSRVRPRSRQPRASSRMVEAGRSYLMDNLSQNISLQDLAAHTGLSPYHFLREFRECYGLPPHSYQLQQRVNAARRRLVKGESIVRIATELGFADQSHFTRKFKGLVGATPRQYRLAYD